MNCYICKEEIDDREYVDNHHPDKENKSDWTEKVHHKCHMIYHEIYPKNYSQLRQLVEARNNYQTSRIQYQLKIGNIKRLGLEPTQLDDDILDMMKKKEKEIIKEYQKIIKELPIWKEWLVHVKGMGLDLSGQLLAYVGDISRFDSVAKLWSYFGYGLYNKKIQCYRKDCNHRYDAKKRGLVYKIIYNGFITHKKWSLYGQMYDIVKQEYRKKHPEPIQNNNGNGRKQNYTDMHIHLMSIRKVAKTFLKDLWVVWRTLENLPVDRPYDNKEYKIPHFNYGNLN